MKKSKSELRTVKLSDIRTYSIRHFESNKNKSLSESIKKKGYVPREFNDWIVVIEWDKSFLGLNYRPFPRLSLWHGNHRMGTLLRLFPKDTKIEVKVKKFPVLLLYTFIFVFLTLFIGGIWLVFTNWWLLILLGITSIGINYLKAKTGKDLIEVIKEKLNIYKTYNDEK